MVTALPTPYSLIGSSGRVGGGQETWNLCGRLWRPSFLWLVSTGLGGAMAPSAPPWIRYCLEHEDCVLRFRYISEPSNTCMLHLNLKTYGNTLHAKQNHNLNIYFLWEKPKISKMIDMPKQHQKKIWVLLFFTKTENIEKRHLIPTFIVLWLVDYLNFIEFWTKVRKEKFSIRLGRKLCEKNLGVMNPITQETSYHLTQHGK